MAKKKFYSICRYKEKTTGDTKVGYMPREGYDVPNVLGFDLAVYRAKDSTAATNWEAAKIWFVVDTRTGLSVAQADTKNAAIEAALSRLESIDMEAYNIAAAKAAKEYGPCPGHRIMYNLVGN